MNKDHVCSYNFGPFNLDQPARMVELLRTNSNKTKPIDQIRALVFQIRKTEKIFISILIDKHKQNL